MERVPEILRIVTDAAKSIDTIISIGVSTRCDDDGASALEAVLEREGFAYWRGKTNLGLGRIPEAADDRHLYREEATVDAFEAAPS